MTRAVAHAVIGIDLDNTIISYDYGCHLLAVDRGWLPATTPVDKRIVRDALRLQPDGEMRWRELQAMLYGSHMHLAAVMPGVLDFLHTCRAANVRTVVVSHKTRFANAFDAGVDLRQAAMAWLDAKGFFNTPVTGLMAEAIWFESERRAKTRRIAALGCGCFIDDLEEVLADPSFPSGVEKILYAPSGHGPKVSSDPDIQVMTHWSKITAHVFGQGRNGC